jgi:predicted GNAT family acetyltransferase
MNKEQTMAKPEIADNPAQSRYELRLEGELAAQAQYCIDGDCVSFTHTEVGPRHEGAGLASKLARHALDDVRVRGLRARPQCSFFASYIERHPQYADLIAD